MTIRARFIALLMAAVIVPVFVITILSALTFRSSAVENFQETSLKEIAIVDQAFTLFLNGLADDVKFLASTEELKALDESVVNYFENSDGRMDALSNSAVEAEAYKLLEDFGESRDYLAYVFLGLDTGGYIQWPQEDFDPSDTYDPTKRPWYPAAKEQPGKPVRAAAYRDATTGAPLIDYLHTFDAANGLQGVIGIDVTLKELTEMVKAVKFGEEGYLILVEETGRILADSKEEENNFKMLEELSDVYSQMANSTELIEVELYGQSWFTVTHVSPGIGWKFIGLIPTSEVFAAANRLTNTIIVLSLLLVALFAGLGYALTKIITKPVLRITEKLQEVASGDGDLTARILSRRKDETGQMASAFNKFIGLIHKLVGEILNNANSVKEQSNESEKLANQISSIADGQSRALEQVATAFNEMVATANEVAKNCGETASAADESQQHVQQGQRVIERTSSSVSQLDQVIQESNDAMTALAEESNNITAILDTIRGIAEQTNLLALNAAIEAARAGEQGRGFAVVADEVRNLAGKTAESTEEINTLLSNLTSRTKDVSEKLSSSMGLSSDTATATEETKEVFSAIQSSVSTIRDMTTQIATAAEEQHSVAEDINQNINEISGQAANATNTAEQMSTSSESLKQVSHELLQLVSKFKV